MLLSCAKYVKNIKVHRLSNDIRKYQVEYTFYMWKRLSLDDIVRKEKTFG